MHLILTANRRKTCFRETAFVVFCILTITTGCTRHGGSSVDTGIERYAKYVAGFSLLTAANKKLPDSLKYQRIRELGTITGLSADSVQNFLRTLRNDPEKGKTFYTIMSRLCEDRPDTLTR